MQAYAGDRDVFIRSMAARGHAGGLRLDDRRRRAVLDAAGFDLVLIETVGTGQSEVEVAAAADTTVVLEAPEMGDEVQAIKAGLLEVADLVVVNKGDRPGAQRTASQLRAMLGGAAARGGRVQRGRAPDVLITTASTGAGVPELLAALDRRRAEARGATTARPAWPGPRPRSGRSSATGSARRLAAPCAPTAGATAAVRDGGRTPARPVRGRRSAARPACCGAVDERRDAASDDDRARLRGRCRADGPRHRPGPRRRSASTVDALRAGPRPGRGRPRSDRRQPGSGGRQGPARRRRPRRDARPGSSRPTGSRVADADLVIEAVFEDVEVKRALWREIDGLARPEAIFATNTESIAIDRLAPRRSRRAGRGSSGCISSARCR